MERRHLGRFLDARAHVTGKHMEPVRADESPDFVVRRETGNYAGLELARVFLRSRNPNEVALPRHLASNPEVKPEINRLIGKKAQLRRSPKSGWSYRMQTILVLTLMDAPITEIAPALNHLPECDYRPAGFVEIWVAEMDPEALDAYVGDIRLYGLMPDKWHGLHDRRHPSRKPWG